MFTLPKISIAIGSHKTGCRPYCVLLYLQSFVHLSIGGVPGHCNLESCNVFLKLSIVGPDRNSVSCLIRPVPGQQGFSAWARAGACFCGVIPEFCSFMCVMWVCGIRGGLRTTVFGGARCRWRCALLGRAAHRIVELCGVAWCRANETVHVGINYKMA